MAKKVKVKPRAISRKKAFKKERERYELRRRSRKAVKKQLNSLFPKDKVFSTPESISLEEKKKLLSLFYKTLDSQQSKGLITKGRVDRLKSKYTKKFNSLFVNSSSQTTNKT